MKSWYLCEVCGCDVPEGMEQRDEEGRLLCPYCFLITADENDFEVPENAKKVR